MENMEIVGWQQDQSTLHALQDSGNWIGQGHKFSVARGQRLTRQWSQMITRQSSYNTIWIVWFAGLSLESEEVVKQVLNDWLQNKVWSNFGTPGKQVFVASSSASRPWNAAAFGWAGTSEGIGVCTVETVYKAILALVFRLPTQGSRNCRKSCDCCFSAAFVSKWHST